MHFRYLCRQNLKFLNTMHNYLLEFLGTLILVLMGDGVCAAVTLNKSKAQNAGWVVIALGWGLAVMCGVFVAHDSGAHLNPAVTLAMCLTGGLGWAEFIPYVVAQMIGGFVGACLVWLVYKDHFAATSDQPDAMLGCFCTAPAIRNTWNNLFSEAVCTFVLLLGILCFGTYGTTVNIGADSALPVTLLIMAIGMSLGSTTGYAMNAARDLSPRLAHALLPIPGKRDSDWSYSWVPVVGPLLGAAAAAGVYLLVY